MDSTMGSTYLILPNSYTILGRAGRRSIDGARCPEGITLRPSLSIDHGSIIGPVLLHELTFCALRSSSFMASARNSALGSTKR
jgi:hypothetical protein